MKTAIEKLIDKLIEKRDLYPASGSNRDRIIRGRYVDSIMLAKDQLEEEKIQKIEFAKMHVTEALKQASEKAIMGIRYVYPEFNEEPKSFISKESILNAYPLDQIK